MYRLCYFIPGNGQETGDRGGGDCLLGGMRFQGGRWEWRMLGIALGDIKCEVERKAGGQAVAPAAMLGATCTGWVASYLACWPWWLAMCKSVRPREAGARQGECSGGSLGIRARGGGRGGGGGVADGVGGVRVTHHAVHVQGAGGHRGHKLLLRAGREGRRSGVCDRSRQGPKRAP